MRKPKPCPFCADVNPTESYVLDESEAKNYVIECDICAAMGPSGKDNKTAWRLWNKREIPYVPISETEH